MGFIVRQFVEGTPVRMPIPSLGLGNGKPREEKGEIPVRNGLQKGQLFGVPEERQPFLHCSVS